MSRSIGVRSLLAGLNSGRFNSLNDIDSAVDSAIEELQAARIDMRKNYLSRAACLHLYRKARFTIQGRLIGCVRVNERTCKHCGHTESFQESQDLDDRPEWAIDASEQYYNNNI